MVLRLNKWERKCASPQHSYFTMLTSFRAGMWVFAIMIIHFMQPHASRWISLVVSVRLQHGDAWDKKYPWAVSQLWHVFYAFVSRSCFISLGISCKVFVAVTSEALKCHLWLCCVRFCYKIESSVLEFYCPSLLEALRWQKFKFSFRHWLADCEQRDNLRGSILIIKTQWYEVERCSFIYERSIHSEVIVLKPGESLIPDIRVCIFRAYLNINAETWSPH